MVRHCRAARARWGNARASNRPVRAPGSGPTSTLAVRIATRVEIARAAILPASTRRRRRQTRGRRLIRSRATTSLVPRLVRSRAKDSRQRAPSPALPLELVLVQSSPRAVQRAARLLAHVAVQQDRGIQVAQPEPRFRMVAWARYAAHRAGGHQQERQNHNAGHCGRRPHSPATNARSASIAATIRFASAISRKALTSFPLTLRFFHFARVRVVDHLPQHLPIFFR